jgi:hypothetical protein
MFSMRQAVPGDISRIWSLLHAESKNWSEVKISKSLDELFLLTVGEKIIGVLFKPEKAMRSEWVVIHPMYPEEKLRGIMIQMLDFTPEETTGKRVKKLSRLETRMGYSGLDE